MGPSIAQQGSMVDLSSPGLCSRTHQLLLGRCPRHYLLTDGSVELSPHMWSTGEDFAWLSHDVVPSLCSVDALVRVGQE